MSSVSFTLILIDIILVVVIVCLTFSILSIIMKMSMDFFILIITIDICLFRAVESLISSIVVRMNYLYFIFFYFIYMFFYLFIFLSFYLFRYFLCVVILKECWQRQDLPHILLLSEISIDILDCLKDVGKILPSLIVWRWPLLL